MNIPITLVKLFEDVTLPKHPHILIPSLHPGRLTAGTYETAIFFQRKMIGTTSPGNYVPAVNLQGVFFVNLISWRQVQLLKQNSTRRGEERSGNFVGVGGHTNVGINDGPKKENLWRRRLNLGFFRSWKRLVEVVNSHIGQFMTWFLPTPL